MRAFAAVLTFAAVLYTVPSQAAENMFMSPPVPGKPMMGASTVSSSSDVREDETPNQRRRRLGQPIVASYPPPEYGELIETPNQRRQRLGLIENPKLGVSVTERGLR